MVKIMKVVVVVLNCVNLSKKSGKSEGFIANDISEGVHKRITEEQGVLTQRHTKLMRDLFTFNLTEILTV